ncbi:hypothetical protein C3L33_19806, partial [Rhododendron williamsianum]
MHCASMLSTTSYSYCRAQQTLEPSCSTTFFHASSPIKNSFLSSRVSLSRRSNLVQRSIPRSLGIPLPTRTRRQGEASSMPLIYHLPISRLARSEGLRSRLSKYSAVRFEVRRRWASPEMSGDGGVVKADATPPSAVELPLTAENVESVLDEIRPYLISDGGNVALHEIDGNVVRLKLQGACGSCPSSVMTMKMGIERRLMEKIPEIVAVEPISDKETGLELNEENIEK